MSLLIWGTVGVVAVAFILLLIAVVCLTLDEGYFYLVSAEKEIELCFCSDIPVYLSEESGNQRVVPDEEPVIRKGAVRVTTQSNPLPAPPEPVITVVLEIDGKGLLDSGVDYRHEGGEFVFVSKPLTKDQIEEFARKHQQALVAQS